MAIPEAQLKTWSAQGSITQSKNTYATIKTALENKNATYADKRYEIFLQGSYGNDTNVYADSDVDIVIKLSSAFFRDLSRLPADQKAAYNASFSDAAYGFSDFRTAVTATLLERFSSDVHLGTKAVWIEPNGGRRKADVLIALQFRRYHEFHSDSNQRYDEGIGFLLPNGTLVENFPKQHSDNLTTKNQNTNGRFKPTVRVFKNMRNHMIEKKMLTEGVAPSYFIEGMLYNVPSEKFSASFTEAVPTCLNWAAQTDQTKLVCGNYMHWLVRDGSSTSWPAANYSKFVGAARDLWNQWK